MKRLAKEKAYRRYRENPSRFFSQRIHSVTDNDEGKLIHPDWPRYWTKYHYNLVENGIMELVTEAKLAQKRLRILDIGTGTGHWVEFYTSQFNVSEMWAVDFCEAPLANLKKREFKAPVHPVEWDISEPLPPRLRGKMFDLINAVGVMFHIVDDAKWERGVQSLLGLLDPIGIAIIGGDFGRRTVERGVMRKNRSLAMWKRICGKYGARVFSLKRYDWWAGADKGGITDNLIGIRKK